MTEARNEIGSITERIRPVDVQAPVVAVHFLGNAAAFVLGEETIVIAGEQGERRVAAHAGGILGSASDGTKIVTCGDDGRIAATRADGTTETVASDDKRRWINHVAIGPENTLAWSVGKEAVVLTGKGEKRVLTVPSTAGGLAFAPRGIRLAVAHYNGASMWFPNSKAPPEEFEWKGSHLDVMFSPDGRFLITSMQEPALHGWRIGDWQHMRMSGYTTKVQSRSWSAGGKWLATSGANQLVMWPFQTKDGPMNQSPTLLAPSDYNVERVACHPVQDIVAVGYDDGMILLVRIEDGAEILVRPPAAAPVTALAWNADGTVLAFGTDAGEAGLLTV
jgi:WD40 repeat protein